MKTKPSFVGGLDFLFLQSGDFEVVPENTDERYYSILVRNILRVLMMGSSSSWSELVSMPLLKAVFLERNPDLLRCLRMEFQLGFDFLYEQLQHKQLMDQEYEQFQLYLSNCLNLLPFTDLTPFELIRLPQWVDERWQQVEYRVKPIELTPQSGFKKAFIYDEDRVFAYGLEPIINHKAQSHLIFLGTTYPAGQGFIPQIKTDLNGGETAGAWLYRHGRKPLCEWLEQQSGTIHVTGLSLGGSLALLLAIDQGEKITRVDAANPPGLHDSIEFDNWSSMQSKPSVVLQVQADDPVSPFGLWKEDWQVLWVNPPADKRGSNPLFDHFLNYAGFAGTQFTYLSVPEENARRSWRNVILYSWGRSLVYYPIILPYNYLLRPILRYFWDNWFLGSKDRATNETNLASLHDPQLPRNPSLDLYHKDNTLSVNYPKQDIQTYNTVMQKLKLHSETIHFNDSPADEQILVETTKAKQLHIKDTVFWAKKRGIDEGEAVFVTLSQHYQLGMRVNSR